MDAFSQKIFSDAFSWIKNFVFQLKFHWSLLLRVQLTINQHWFDISLALTRQQAIIWTNADPIHLCIYAALRMIYLFVYIYLILIFGMVVFIMDCLFSGDAISQSYSVYDTDLIFLKFSGMQCWKKRIITVTINFTITAIRCQSLV